MKHKATVVIVLLWDTSQWYCNACMNGITKLRPVWFLRYSYLNPLILFSYLIFYSLLFLNSLNNVFSSNI